MATDAKSTKLQGAVLTDIHPFVKGVVSKKSTADIKKGNNSITFVRVLLPELDNIPIPVPSDETKALYDEFCKSVGKVNVPRFCNPVLTVAMSKSTFEVTGKENGQDVYAVRLTETGLAGERCVRVSQKFTAPDGQVKYLKTKIYTDELLKAYEERHEGSKEPITFSRIGYRKEQIMEKPVTQEEVTADIPEKAQETEAKQSVTPQVAADKMPTANPAVEQPVEQAKETETVQPQTEIKYVESSFEDDDLFE